MLALLFSFAAAATPPTVPFRGLAPADDCRLYELIHREQFASRNATDHGLDLRAWHGWGKGVMTCPGWKQWDAAPTEVVVFDPPSVSRRGDTATVDYTQLVFNHHRDVYRVTGTATYRCMFNRDRAGWRLRTCAELGVADH